MDSFTHLGLDVHKEKIAVSVLHPQEQTPTFRVIENTPEAVRKLVSKLGATDRLRACYEAGCTGYDTYRLLDSLGVRCDVIAPSLIPRRAGSHIKTDRLDSHNLCRLHRAGELTPIRVPSREEEALRDLIRVREDLKDDRRRAQQRIKSFLLRQGRRYPGNSAGWGVKFDAWVRSQSFTDHAAQLAFDHYLAARTAQDAQLQAVDAEIERVASLAPLAEPVALLRCLRGIDTLAAVTIAVEVCDFRRYATAASFMSSTGLVPSEHSSGARERRGSVTKSGNRHVRRVLVEAAWCYRHRPHVGAGLAKRSEGLPADALAYSWKAQLRLNARFWKLAHKGHKNAAAVAVARELAGFVWGLMTGRTAA